MCTALHPTPPRRSSADRASSWKRHHAMESIVRRLSDFSTRRGRPDQDLPNCSGFLFNTPVIPVTYSGQRCIPVRPRRVFEWWLRSIDGHAAVQEHRWLEPQRTRSPFQDAERARSAARLRLEPELDHQLHPIQLEARAARVPRPRLLRSGHMDAHRRDGARTHKFGKFQLPKPSTKVGLSRSPRATANWT